MSSSTEIKAEAIVAPGLGSLATTRTFTMGLLEPITKVQMLTRPCDNANHTAYVLGHISWTDDTFLTALAGTDSALPQGWADKFGMNAALSDDASSYPSKEELVRVMTERREAMIAWLSSLSHDELVAPVEGDLAQFASTRAALPGTLAFHEGFHAGQMSVCRRKLGIELMF